MAKTLRKQDYFEDPSLPLQVCLRDPQPEFPLHAHGFDELVIILNGTAMHTVDGQPFPVKSGDVFVVSGKHKHQFVQLNHLSLANILFDGHALDMPDWDIRSLPGFHALFEIEPVLRPQQRYNSRLHLSGPRLARAVNLVHDLMHETTERPPGYRVMAKGLFMQLAVYLSRSYGETPPPNSPNLLRLGGAIACIETHYAEKLTIDELARTAHLSTRHFQRIFRELMGRSPVEYLLHVRVRQAMHLLRSTSRPITDIALECGFSDSNYFSRQFRKMTGQTPLHCRKTATNSLA